MSSRESDAAEIFIEAVEQHESAERPAFIEQACGGDEELRERVEILLKAHDESNQWFDRDRIIVSLDQSIAEGPGTVIGSYKLMEQIGEGGMGVVYVAQQLRPMRRRVALKVIKPGMDTKEVISRFAAERQALALMDHPNIAKVHDAGTTDSGRPYFVMELVRGIAITEYCDLNRLNARQRLELFVHMCNAVQHAHQKGVIHRDLKPSNVLITEHDGTPVVKVIDFGVAKAINQQLTERTIYTRHQQMVGTPMYMSPEQAELSGLDVDTRSDIYSLGVLLYELLTGTTPFDKQRLSEAAYDEIRRIIREEEPSKPSTKVRTLGKTASSISGYRGTDPDKLSQQLRGDLDWIVMKSLEKDRSRRYETANGLAHDIERYLNDEPVMACPPSAVYRFRKFARRNTAAMVTFALVTTALLLGAAVSTWQAVRTNAERIRAVSAEHEANSERDRAIEAEQAERRLRLRAQEQAYVADMNLAHQAWEAGDVDGMTRLLDRYQVQPNQMDLRGFQWSHLWYLCQRSRNTPFLNHGTRIMSMDISPDDRMVATVGYSAFLKLWDIRSQRLLEEVPGPWLVASTAFSPDGEHVAYKLPGAMVLRDLSHGGEDRRFRCRSGTFSTAFSPDGTRLAAAGFGEVVFLWDLESDKALTLKGHDFLIWKVAFSPDGRTLASAGSHEVILWDVESGEKRHVLPMDASPGQSVAFAPDGKTLATGGGQAGALRLWDPQTGRMRASFEGQAPGGIGSLAYSSDGHYLAAGSWDGAVVLLEPATGTRLDVFKGHQQEIFVLRFSKDNGTLASASFDGTVRLWDVTARRPIDLLEGHTEPVASVALSADGSVVVSGGVDGMVRFWDVQSGEELAALQLHQFPVEAVAISPDGRKAASVSWGGKAVVTDLALGKSTDLPDSMPNTVVFSPDSTTLMVGGANGTVRLWDTTTLAPRRLDSGHKQMIRALAISPNGNVLATGSWDNTIKLRDLKTGDVQRTMQGQRGLECLAFSPDGQTLASGGGNNTVNLWDIQTGQQHPLNGHTGPINSLSFSPDGKILASASNDRTIRLWYLGTAKEPEILPEYAPVKSVAFSPDGATLASASGHRVRLWRTVAPSNPMQVTRLATLEQHARMIAEADAQQQRQLLERLRNHLVASAERRLLLRDLTLATFTLRRLDNSGQSQLARGAFRSFATIVARGEDPHRAEWATTWEAQE